MDITVLNNIVKNFIYFIYIIVGEKCLFFWFWILLVYVKGTSVICNFLPLRLVVTIIPKLIKLLLYYYISTSLSLDLSRSLLPSPEVRTPQKTQSGTPYLSQIFTFSCPFFRSFEVGLFSQPYTIGHGVDYLLMDFHWEVVILNLFN